MLAGTLAFASGIACFLNLEAFPHREIVLLLPVCFLCGRYFTLFKWTLCFLLGFCWSMIRLEHAFGPTVAESVLANEVTITGIVVSLPEHFEDHVRFKFKISEIIDTNSIIHKPDLTARLNWYKTKQIPAPGEIWQFKTKLKRPYGFMNPGGFDYEFWLLRKGINLQGYIKNYSNNIKINDASGHYLQQLRYELSEKINQSLDNSISGFALALSLGERSQLNPHHWQTLTRTGTNHLFAISGLHLALVAGIVFIFSRYIVSRFIFVTNRIPAPFFAALIAFVVVFFYAALAGFSLPTQRALIMIGAFMLVRFTGHQFKSYFVISFAVIVILILDPFSIIAVDFWLSFYAVCIILYLTRFRQSSDSKLLRWTKLQVLISISIFPLLIFWFKQIPVLSIFANLVAIPIIGFIIVPLLLIALLLLFPFPQLSLRLYDFISFINQSLWSYLEFIAKQEISVVAIASPNLFTLTLAVIGLLLFLAPRGVPGRYLGIIWLLPLFFPIIDKPLENEFDLTVLDVGQGLSALIQTKNHVLVYDTGARFSDRFNIGDAVIIPYLKDKGIKSISTLMVSHGDNDHIGGTDALINHFNMERVITSVPSKIHYHRVQRCQAGQNWIWDGILFEILHPQPGDFTASNNSSCVLKVSGHRGSVLLTGDIEKQAENELVNKYQEKLKSNILLVPHHGSKTSSTLEFIQQVDPKYAIISAGYRNRFGFPKQVIMQKYEKQGIETRVTYRTGAITARFRQDGVKLDAYRQENKRIWHHDSE